MPLRRDEGGSAAIEQALQVFGIQAPPPEPPTAAPTLGSAPTVSATPVPGQGVALTVSGNLPTTAKVTGIRMLTADPVGAAVGEFWFRSDLLQMSFMTSSGVKRSSSYAARTISGKVSSAGALVGSFDDSFTVAHTGTGVYTVTYGTAFTATPAAVVTVSQDATVRVTTDATSTSSALVVVVRNVSTNALTDAAFDFVVKGN